MVLQVAADPARTVGDHELAYAATIGSALLGVIVATAMAQQPGLALLAGAGALTVGLITRQARVGGRA